MPATTAPSSATQDEYGVSAGLDLVSGVLGFISSLNASSVANSRAGLIEAEANANAQRYQEQADQYEAQEKVMYTSSGVKLSGSPLDALATTARIASENVAAIQMQGEIQATDETQKGTNAVTEGANLLIKGTADANKQIATGFSTPPPSVPGGAYGFGEITT